MNSIKSNSVVLGYTFYIITIIIHFIMYNNICSIAEAFILPITTCTSPVRTLPVTAPLQLAAAANNKQTEATPNASFMIQEFALMEQLSEIVQLSSQPMPERPDGIVCVVKWTSATRPVCTQTESEYERLARAHPDTIFLRCYEEVEDALITITNAKVTTFPTFDVFYGGNRVARMEGPEYGLVHEQILRHGMINSKLDLFSEEADNQKRLAAWGDGKINPDYNATPRTTARFIPGYDWDSNDSFFDTAANKAAKDFEGQYENWVPPMDEK